MFTVVSAHYSVHGGDVTIIHDSLDLTIQALDMGPHCMTLPGLGHLPVLWTLDFTVQGTLGSANSTFNMNEHRKLSESPQVWGRRRRCP